MVASTTAEFSDAVRAGASPEFRSEFGACVKFGFASHSASTRLRSLYELRRARVTPKGLAAKAEDARERAYGSRPGMTFRGAHSSRWPAPSLAARRAQQGERMRCIGVLLPPTRLMRQHGARASVRQRNVACVLADHLQGHWRERGEALPERLSGA